MFCGAPFPLPEAKGRSPVFRRAAHINRTAWQPGIRSRDLHPAGEGEENRLPLLDPLVMEGPARDQVVFRPGEGAARKGRSPVFCRAAHINRTAWQPMGSKNALSHRARQDIAY